MGRLAGYILANQYKAIFVTAFFGAMSLFLLPLSFFSGAALALVVLRKGFGQAFQVLSVSALLIGASWILSPAKPGFPFPVVFALWAPVLVGAWWLRFTTSQAKTLLAVAVVCALFVVGMYIAVGDPLAWWNEWRQTAMPASANPAGAQLDLDDENRLFNGFMAMGLGFGAMFTLCFARWMQATLFNPGGFGVEFMAIRLDRMVLLWILIILIASGIFNIQMMTDLLMVAIMVYDFPGIALLYAIVVRKRLNPNWMVVPFLGVYFLPPIMIPALAILGVADSFLDFRRRIK